MRVILQVEGIGREAIFTREQTVARFDHEVEDLVRLLERAFEDGKRWAEGSPDA